MESMHTGKQAPAALWRARVWWWARLTLVLAMLAALVVIARPGRLWTALVQTQYLWVLAGVPFAFAATVLDAFRLHWLMRPTGFRGGWGAVLRTNLVVNFVSLFLPGTVGGGAVAWYRLSQPDNLRAQTFVALSLNTALKLAALCAAGCVALALDAGAAGKYGAWMAPLLLGAAAPLAVLALMLWTPMPQWILRLHISFLDHLLPRRIHAALRKMIESLVTYQQAQEAIILALAVGTARILVGTLVPLFCLYAVGIQDFPYARILWIMAVVEVAGMLPITLSGCGLPQVAYVALMAAAGVSADKSFASNLIGWGAWLPVLLMGAGVMALESTSCSKK